MRRDLPSASLVLTLSCVAALLISVGIPAAGAAGKKFGYDSQVGGGKGAEFTPAEYLKITAALAKITEETVTTKEASYNVAAIVEELTAMLTSGRMGKGVGADKGIAAVTASDGKASTEGDLMNIADYLIKDGSNGELANTLVHEWLHATQTGGTEAEQEAPAYQLGRQIYFDKGGLETDDPAISDSLQIDDFKKIIENAKAVIPDAKVPAKGAEGKRSGCGQEYYLYQNPGRIYFWSDGARLDSVVAAPNQMFFTFLDFPAPPACDRLLIFGTDRSIPSNPIGTLTVVDANESGFFARNDLLLPGLRYPFSVTRDSTTQKLYVLDAHFTGPGIVSMQDLNGDRIPDTMQPFAPRGFAGVDSAEAIAWAELPGLGNGLAIDDMDDRGDDFLVPTEHLTFLRDTNLDGLADFVATIRETDLASFAPHFTTHPHPGDVTVEIQCMPGHFVQIVLTDASGDANFGVIGAGTGSPSGLPQMIPVGVLPNNQFVKAVDLTANTQAAHPTLLTAVTNGAPDGSGVAGALSLRAFPSVMRIRTTLAYRLTRQSRARLVMMDAAGREVRTLVDRTAAPGEYAAIWDGTNQIGQPVRSGVYYATLVSGEARKAIRVVVLR